MSQLEIFTYGVLWRNYRNEQAGRELVRALRSGETRELAAMLIKEGGPRLVELIQSALDAGEISAQEAADCIADRTSARASVTWNVTSALPIGIGCSGPQLVQLTSHA